MPKASHIRTSFNAGELSPLLDGRVDINKYNNGCTVLENFIPSVQGPAVRRGGTRFVAEVKNNSHRTWLQRFEFSNSQSFVLEFGNNYVRFFFNRGQLLSGGSPYEISSPWPIADLTTADGFFALDMVQSGDVIYIAHPNYPLYKLSRLGNTNWTLAAVGFYGGPFLDQNTDRTVTVYASATTGSVTLTASSAIFSSSHVGALFYLEPADLSTIKPWTAGQEYTANPYGILRRSDGKTYSCVTNLAPNVGKFFRTGPDKPIHTYGTASDGDGNGINGTNCERQGIEWQFIDNGYGYVQITGFTSSTVVTATVIDTLPLGVVNLANKTFRWAFGAFSANVGYPSSVTFFRERLTLGKGQKLYFSVSADFENFSATDDSNLVTADRAIQVTISSDQVNEIQWLSSSQALIIGTTGGEYACAENSTADPFAPGNVKIEQQTSNGSRPVAPVRVGYSTLSIQRSGRKLFETAYNFQQNGYVGTDLTVLSEHIMQGGVIQMAWHREPYVALWCVRADGQLLGFTFNKEQDVVGWHRHIIGGTFSSGDAVVESLTVIPSPDGTRDDLWMIVKRTINGSTKRFVEYLNAEYRTGDNQADAFYVDAGGTYSGAATTTLSGLSYLEGQTVQVLVNGAAHPDRVVSGGQISLQVAATKAQVGLPYVSKLTMTRIEAGAMDGTSQGKTKRITRAILRLFNTLGAKAGPDENTLDIIQFRKPEDDMNAPPPLFTGDKEIQWPGSYDFDGYVTVVQDQPMPMTIVAIVAQLMTFDR